jgi:hypothetical protein
MGEKLQVRIHKRVSDDLVRIVVVDDADIIKAVIDFEPRDAVSVGENLKAVGAEMLQSRSEALH